jgi:uncharacterized cupin superfamily protein
MPKIKIEQPTPELLKKLGIDSWSSWDCDSSEFDWEYPETEIAYVQKGRAIVVEEGGNEVELKAGDRVTFPKGLKCRWKVIERIEKVYTFQ